MKKRILSLLLTVAMVVTMMPAVSMTASAGTPSGTALSGNLGIKTLATGTYYLSDDATGKITVTIGNGTGEGKNGVEVPSTMVVGVTTQTAPTEDTPVAITSNGASTDRQYFDSDKAAYIVKFNTDHLELGIKPPHTHSWSYTASRSVSTLDYNDTITASCTDGCDYEGADKTLTIQAPASPEYDGNAHNATFGTASTFLGESLPTITYEYKATVDGAYSTVGETKKAGYYKASFTVGEGTDAKTASVEYQVKPLKLEVENTNVTTTKTYDGTVSAAVTAGDLTNKVSTDAVTLTATGTYNNKNAGMEKAITVTYSISGADAANYTAPDANTTDFRGIISPKKLTISGTKVSDKTYDGTTEASATAGTVEGIVSGDTAKVEIYEAVFDDKNAGNNKIVNISYKISGEDKDNYSAPYDQSIAANISKKTVEVKAENKSSYVGSDLAALTYTNDALCTGDSFTGALETNADKDVVGNAYTITQGTLTAGDNYTINFTSGTYTVKALETQTLTFADGDQTKIYGDTVFQKEVSGAYTTVTYESSNPSVATVDSANGTVTIVGVGTTIIKAKAAEDSTYAEAEASYKLTVKKKKTADKGDDQEEDQQKTGDCPQDETCVYAKFTDADTKAWYHDGVHFCVENTYMKGVADYEFAPYGTLSRAMIVTMLWRMEGSPAADYEMTFGDVADNQWYTEAIRWAQSTGVVTGYNEKDFGPDDNVTREQLAAILMRYARFKGIDVTARADLSKFVDAESISDWALENIKWANAAGIINGRTETTIAPADGATRAEAACMIQRFCETVIK